MANYIAVSAVCNTFVFICIRCACLGCWSRQAFHAIHSAHSCGNTQCVRTELSTHSYENPDTGRDTRRVYAEFRRVNITTRYLVIDATQAAAVLTLAQLLLQLNCKYQVSIFLWQLISTFLRHPVPAESNYYFPAIPRPRLHIHKSLPVRYCIRQQK